MNKYPAALKEAAEAWRAGNGETDAWARPALGALLSGEQTTLSLAQSVYRMLGPLNARGELVGPRILRGRLTVRNLENSSFPVPGAAAARKNFEAVLNFLKISI